MSDGTDRLSAEEIDRAIRDGMRTLFAHNPAGDDAAVPVAAGFSHCSHCDGMFEPKRPHHRFCRTACRNAYHRTRPVSDGASATVRTLRVLKSGRVAAVIHFEDADRERALHMLPGQPVKVAASD